MSTQIPDPVSVTNSAEVVIPNQAVAPVGQSASIRELHPAYRYQNPVAFRNNIVSNSEFRNRFIEDLFEIQNREDENFRQELEQNPERFAEYRRQTEGRLLADMYAEMSTGEELVDAIARRGSELAGINFNPARIPDYIRTVTAFPDKYERFHITDGKNLTGHFRENPQLIGQLARTDANFRDQLYRDRFDVFIATLSQSHNRHGIDTNDVNQVAKAFSIFENYGAEGLTQYVNYFQRYIPGMPLAQQSPTVREAHAFFSSNDFQGRSPSEIANEFIGSEDSPNGRLTFTPQRMSMELGQDVPLDLNNFTRFFRDSNSTNALLSAAQGRGFHSVTEEGITQPITVDPSFTEEFMTTIREGVPSKKADGVAFEIMRLAREEQGFTQEDLFATIAVHATAQEGERGAIEYVFNPDELPETAKIAYRALNLDFSTHGATAFRNAGNGMVAMEPNRQERIQSQSRNFGGYRLVNRERVPLFNERGDIVAFEEGFNPRALSFDYPNLVIGRSSQFLNDYVLTPGMNFTARALEFFGADERADAITSSDFYTRTREAGDFNPYDEVSSFLGGGGGALLLTDLGAYIAASLAIGKAAAATGGAALGAVAARAATSANSTRMVAQAGQFLQGATAPTRWQAQAMKTAQVLKDRAPSHTVFLRGELGAGTLEILGGTRRSMLANPFVDDILSKVGIPAEIEKRYAMADNFTRAGLDLLGSVGIGFSADNLFASVKYAGNIFRVGQGKTARGVRFNKILGDYDKANEAVFAPEWRRLLHDMTTGLQEMPLGSVADTQANMFLGRQIFRNPENINTLEDVVGVMNHNFTDFFSTMKDDIENTIRFWDAQLGGANRYDEDMIAQRTDVLFNELVDKIADGMVAIYRNQDPDKLDLITFMAQRMRDQGPTVQSLAYMTPQGPKYMLNSLEANTLASSNPNAVIREVPMPDGSVMYSVQTVDEGFWGTAMSDAIMRRYSEVTTEDVIQRNIRRLGLPEEPVGDDLARAQSVSEKAHRVIGKEVVHDNQRGYIVDFDPRREDVYTVRGIDGVERQAIIPDETLGFRSMENRLVVNKELGNDYSAFLYQQARQAGQAMDTGTAMPGPVPASRQLAQGDSELYNAVRGAVSDMGADDIAAEMTMGMSPQTLIGQAQRVGVPETELRRIATERFSERIAAAERRIEAIGKDKRIKNEATRTRKIAEQQSIIDDNRLLIEEFNNEITAAYGGQTRQLADTAFNESFRSPISTLAKWYRDAKLKAKKMREDARLVSGTTSKAILPSSGPFRDKFGIGQRMMDQISTSTGGRILASIPGVRKIVIGLGSDNNLVDNIAKIAYNKGRIEPLRVGNVKKYTAVAYDGDVYMARQGIREADIRSGLAKPSVWVMNKTGEVSMNPYWARVNRNATVDPVTGQMEMYVRDGNGRYGPIYRLATEADPMPDRVYLNIQNPVKRPPRNGIEGVMEKNIDGIHTLENGVKRYEVISDADQAIAVTKVHEIDASFGLRSRTMESIGIC